ncbi:MAG: glycoside hydrolase family 3 protein [Ignavibacteria bacterium]|nr:glycoside hydrolase family 3 protein [Ignavibacteria bacterium]
MTDNQRLVNSLFMIRADAEFWDQEQYRDKINGWIDKGIGGIGVFKGELEQTAGMIQDFQRRGGHNLLIGADLEYGLPMRLDGGIAYPRAMALGKTVSGVTYRVAECIALEAKAIGIHWNWAPVADINSNADNPIINTRSFGEDPATVSDHVVAFVDGLQKMGLLACVKHFPGHGDTSTDSHISIPEITISAAVMAKREYLPFKRAIEQGVRSLMVGHIVVPFFDEKLPASLNSKVITDLVKGKWGFSGLVVTDALDMGAITANYSSAQAAVLAVQAGADVILMPADTEMATTAVLNEFEKGAIPESRIQDALARWKGAKDFVMPKPRRPQEPIVIDQSAHAQIALKAADRAINVVGNAELLPITQHAHVAAFAVINENEGVSATTFFNYIAQATEGNIDFGFIDGSMSDADLNELISGTAGAEVFVFAFFGKAVAYQGNIQELENLPRIFEKLRGGKPCIVVACGSPYGIENVASDCTLYTYSDTTPSIAASVLRLIGRSPE